MENQTDLKRRTLEGWRVRKKMKRRGEFRHKDRAREMVRYALKKGKLIRGLCEVCGEGCCEAHHDDYSKPLEVRWLCHIHHKQLHKELNEAERKNRQQPETYSQDATGQGLLRLCVISNGQRVSRPDSRQEQENLAS